MLKCDVAVAAGLLRAVLSGCTPFLVSRWTEGAVSGEPVAWPALPPLGPAEQE